MFRSHQSTSAAACMVASVVGYHFFDRPHHPKKVHLMTDKYQAAGQASVQLGGPMGCCHTASSFLLFFIRSLTTLSIHPIPYHRPSIIMEA